MAFGLSEKECQDAFDGAEKSDKSDSKDEYDKYDRKITSSPPSIWYKAVHKYDGKLPLYDFNCVLFVGIFRLGHYFIFFLFCENI